MEKTGLTNRVYRLINEYKTKKVNTEKTNEKKSENKIFNQLSGTLKEINKSKNIADMLDAERAMLNYELSNCENIPLNKGRITGLNSAIEDLDKASEMIGYVRNSERYKIQSELYSNHKIDKVNGVPRDAFHRFIDSHKTRLRNKLISADASFEERNYTQERYNLMQAAKKEYMHLQSKALGVTIPSKSKEIER